MDGISYPRARAGRDWLILLAAVIFFGFNPRARVGRDCHDMGYDLDGYVSIHAPAWGATMEIK